MDSNGVSITIGKALDGKLHDISHYAEWGVAQVPLPAQDPLRRAIETELTSL